VSRPIGLSQSVFDSSLPVARNPAGPDVGVAMPLSDPASRIGKLRMSVPRLARMTEHALAACTQFAIIDITAVPTVDTLVAQHLIKTISAARLMGADCIISGIRPQIAQTIVQLGLDLTASSKATMADTSALALRRIGKSHIA
jgi:anti-anti-sigma regulatory factor